MLILFLRFSGQFRPRIDSNSNSNQPPSKKPDGEQTQKSSAHKNQIQTNVRYHNIGQIYHLERRFIH
jgi:hypothetical protein